MAGKWEKKGAKITGMEQVNRKVEGKLHDWDFLPIGQKIGKIESLLSALKSPSGEFKFLSLAGPDGLKGIESRLAERLKAERHSLDDMKRVFEHYGVDLGKAGVRPEDISHPHGTKLSLHKEHGLLLFTSPSLEKWYEKNVQAQNLQPSLQAPPREVLAAIRREKAFGIGRMSAYGKLLRYLPRRSVDVELIQPLMFYRTKGLVEGAGGTKMAVPLQNPDLLLFYAQLKKAKELGAKTVRVLNFPQYTMARSLVEGKPVFKKEEIVYHKMPYRSIYQRIMRMSPNPGEIDATRSVFVAERKR